MIKKWGRLAIIGRMLGPIVLSGCSSALPIVPYPTGVTPPRTVAVMPLDNQTASIPGGIYLREVMYNNLGRKGYMGMPLSEVDQLLSDQLGISLGGQILEDNIQTIGKTLGVDAIITGTVQKFGTVLLLYSEVEATFSLYETNTGKQFWNYHGYASLKTELTSQKGEYHSSILVDVVNRGMGKPLAPVVEEFYCKLFRAMPTGPEPLQRKYGIC